MNLKNGKTVRILGRHGERLLVEVDGKERCLCLAEEVDASAEIIDAEVKRIVEDAAAAVKMATVAYSAAMARWREATGE